MDWFNAVDATYQQQLRDTNDRNWGRFEAKLEAQGGRFEAKLEAQGGMLRSEMAALRADLRADMAAMRASLLKWMFVFWAGTIATLGGLIIALTGR